MEELKHIESIDALINTVDLEKFNTDQRYRNEVFNKMAEIINKDPSQLEGMFNLMYKEGGDPEFKNKLKTITAGLTPTEFAAIVALDAPTAIAFKEGNQVSHVFHYFGPAGIGKTQTVTNALNSVNGIIFQIGAKLKQGASKEDIKKELKAYTDFLNKQFEELGIKIDHDSFSEKLIAATEAFSRILSRDSTLQGLQNETLDTISKNPEQNQLDNVVAAMTSIITISDDGKQTELRKVSPGKPVLTQNDFLQNIIDPQAYNTLIQKLGEAAFSSGLLVFSSNHTEAAYKNLAEVFAQNEGYEARAGLFINAVGPRSKDTTIEAEAASSLTIDKILLHLIENIDSQSKTGELPPLLRQFIKNDKSGSRLGLLQKLKEEYNRLSKILKDEEIADSLFAFLQGQHEALIENGNYTAAEYDPASGKTRTVHKGQSELLRALFDIFIPDPDSKDERHIFQGLKGLLSDALKEVLSFGEFLANTGADVQVNKTKRGSLKDLKDLKKIAEQSLEGKDVKTDGQRNDDVKKLAENLRKSFKETGQENDPGQPVAGSIEETANKLANEVGSGGKLTEKGQELFKRLNLRGVCGVSKDQAKVLNDVENLRQIKIAVSVLNGLKQVLDPESYRSVALRFILGTFGFNELSKELIRMYVLGSEVSTKTVTSKEVREELDKFAKEQNVDDKNKEEALDKLAEFFVKKLYPDYVRMDSEGEIKSPEAFVTSQIGDKLFKVAEKLKGVEDYENFDQASLGDEFEPVRNFIENLSKLKEEDLEKLVEKIQELAGGKDIDDMLGLVSALTQELPDTAKPLFDNGDPTKLYKAMPKQQQETFKEISNRACRNDGAKSIKENAFKAFENKTDIKDIRNTVAAMSVFKLGDMA